MWDGQVALAAWVGPAERPFPECQYDDNTGLAQERGSLCPRVSGWRGRRTLSLEAVPAFGTMSSDSMLEDRHLLLGTPWVFPLLTNLWTRVK